MTISPKIRSLAAAAVASTLLLSACGESEETPTETPSVETSEVVEPSEEPTVEESPAEDPSEAPTPEDSADAGESPAPQPSSTREPVSTGPLEGEELNASGVAWFDAFCTGVAEATGFAGPDTTGMAKDEVLKTVVTTYENIGGSFTATGKKLASLDTAMNFENADAFASNASAAVDEVGTLYTQGAQTVAGGSYANETELLGEINQIEADVVSAGGGDFGLSDLDESVLASVGAQVPACGNL